MLGLPGHQAGGLAEAGGAWVVWGSSKKLESALGIGAVATSQSVSSASGQRVWPWAQPGPDLDRCPVPALWRGRACAGPQSCDTKGAIGEGLIPGLWPRGIRSRCAGGLSGSHWRAGAGAGAAQDRREHPCMQLPVRQPGRVLLRR